MLELNVSRVYRETGRKSFPHLPQDRSKIYSKTEYIPESIVLKRWNSFVPFRFTHFLELTLLLENNRGADSKRPFNI